MRVSVCEDPSVGRNGFPISHGCQTQADSRPIGTGHCTSPDPGALPVAAAAAAAPAAAAESFRRVYLHRKGRRRWFTRTWPAAWVMWEGSSAAATTVRMGCLYSFPLSPEDEEVLALVASLEKECLNSGIVIMLSEAAVKKQEQQRDL
ncbi:hypothetical protein AXG93_1112s1280 [Marchantia polymorpha subsp. ruderalis]|uniref:Uncharacterized protein n=1 Tax=Marchantia polymorpha subsp. ruderalis TaxID=1480154 RepID=A0A176WBV2_MARPO|nr:hypothetical protein AXG93_1112s1280 [Marchantia polymorpha subsp. ruderalis]